MEMKKKRRKKSYYFIAENPVVLNTIRETEMYLEANGKKEGTVIICGEKKEHIIIQKIKINPVL